ncbi:protein D7-like [Manacus candei]|uniref:protein D7-like n=1 Tax=Manacus candei TaxID=415023 RepID=UPI002226DB23|nr:protein D7-like [Manacus candei]
MEPEALVQCPYDRNHRVRVSRLPYHLVRTTLRRPALWPRVPSTRDTGSRGATCGTTSAPAPTGACWTPPQAPRTRPGALWGHPRSPPEAWQPPPCREYWDAELDALEEPPPFILKVTRLDLPVPRARYDPRGTPRVSPECHPRGCPPPRPPRAGAEPGGPRDPRRARPRGAPAR